MSHFLSEFIHGHKKIHYTEMGELYVSLSLRALALGVGGIFVPLFLYDIGFSILMIAGFYIFSMGVRIPLEFLAAKSIGSLGAKHTMSISYCSLFLYFLTLYGMTFFPWLWPVAAVFLALEMSFFWVAYHLQVSSFRSSDKASSQVGIILILKRVFMAVGPLLGGVVAAVYGVEFTLPLAALLLSFAAYPLFKTADTKPLQTDIRSINFSIGKDELSHFAWQLSGVIVAYLWPLWLLLILGSYTQIGSIIALSVVVGVVMTFWIGRMGDKGYNDLFLKIGAGIKALAHLLRVVASSFGLAFLANATNDLADNFISGPFTEKFYEASDQGERFRYVLKINVISALGKFLSWVLLLALVLALSDMVALQVMFVLAAVSVPALLWVSKRG